MHLNYNSSHHRSNHHHRNANDKEMLYGLIHHTTKTSKPTSDVRSSALLKDLFPAGHKLRKIFNRNTIKLSYSCMTNVKQIIDGHSKAILKMAETAQLQKDGGKTCSCRKKRRLPNERRMPGEWSRLSRVPSHGDNPRQKRDIHRSQSYSVQGKIQKPPDVI